ncbi:hypothetical protein GUITHDRAFT_151835 [Guillardia theta CCMP2712]|uniref:Uncharacterized protein n=1 Tax=Guillardia theta (strain CCMP2712) TaxID=905079 RepID=L1JIB6_GUITC|nr:hypothetical protein GUITHDRAFT_151835 [Guillardia theta CCMP2712]EKX48241.1 hypothetical protein GUITHDRAFT_151835 [Guillardia theta CCMP2712]|eukprot:XP_005835221.1 hypothetical protein GUITHDRAFT_151835 [Guillardia theta CCMP2712]
MHEIQQQVTSRKGEQIEVLPLEKEEEKRGKREDRGKTEEKEKEEKPFQHVEGLQVAEETLEDGGEGARSEATLQAQESMETCDYFYSLEEKRIAASRIESRIAGIASDEDVGASDPQSSDANIVNGSVRGNLGFTVSRVEVKESTAGIANARLLGQRISTRCNKK